MVPLSGPLADTGSSVSANTVFYLTLLFIFLTAIVTTVFTKWARDKCLKFFRSYRCTLERARGQTMWGRLKVFSSGVEVIYDHPHIDVRGREKTSFMIYQAELDQQIHSILRFHDTLPPDQQKRRKRQIRRAFNPGPLRRLWRGVRNIVNTLRDAFSAAINATVNQFQRANPASAVLNTQGGAVTNIGQTLLGQFARAYEPLLEQYIGQPVILDVADPLNPNNAIVEYAGFLAEYTQQFIVILNVAHEDAAEFSIQLPDQSRGDPLPPLGAPPAPGAPAPVLPAPLSEQEGLQVRLSDTRFKILNTRIAPVRIARLEREGEAPILLDMILPASATLDLPARDAHEAKLVAREIRCLDVIALRKFATIRHAGRQLERRGLTEEIQLSELPLLSSLFGHSDEK